MIDLHSGFLADCGRWRKTRVRGFQQSERGRSPSASKSNPSRTHTHTHKTIKIEWLLINRTWAKMFVVIRCIPILVEFQIQRGEPRRWELLRVAYRQWSWRRRGNDRDRRPGWARRRRISCNSAARRCKWWPATIQLTSGTAGGIDE